LDSNPSMSQQIRYQELPLLQINVTPTSHYYTLSLHDALPISPISIPLSIPTTCFLPPSTSPRATADGMARRWTNAIPNSVALGEDRKSTRLNSSHVSISYAVFCLKIKIKSRLLYLFL